MKGGIKRIDIYYYCQWVWHRWLDVLFAVYVTRLWIHTHHIVRIPSNPLVEVVILSLVAGSHTEFLGVEERNYQPSDFSGDRWLLFCLTSHKACLFEFKFLSNKKQFVFHKRPHILSWKLGTQSPSFIFPSIAFHVIPQHKCWPKNINLRLKVYGFNF